MRENWKIYSVAHMHRHESENRGHPLTVQEFLLSGQGSAPTQFTTLARHFMHSKEKCHILWKYKDLYVKLRNLYERGVIYFVVLSLSLG